MEELQLPDERKGNTAKKTIDIGESTLQKVLVAQLVKNLPEMRETVLTPGSRRPAGEGNAYPLQTEWTEEPGGLQSMRS